MVYNLALFCLATVWATYPKIGPIFPKSSGHPAQDLPTNIILGINV
jgi:hypothetical protein